VFNYDRRGRAESGDTAPYAIQREIEDLDALIAQAGGSASVFGYSSGAILSLRAAAKGLSISRLALYDPPPTGGKAGTLAPQLTELITAGRRGEAVELFQTKAVGIPAEVVAQLRNAPFRPALEKLAHTLIYESTILGSMPRGLVSSVQIPTLVLDAEKDPEVMHQAAQSLAEALPKGRYRRLEGQTHDIVPAVVAPVLEEFLLVQQPGKK
jgi:pimeloyl-ACP methyl ester carboxylesterase